MSTIGKMMLEDVQAGLRAAREADSFHGVGGQETSGALGQPESHGLKEIRYSVWDTAEEAQRHAEDLQREGKKATVRPENGKFAVYVLQERLTPRYRRIAHNLRNLPESQWKDACRKQMVPKRFVEAVLCEAKALLERREQQKRTLLEEGPSFISAATRRKLKEAGLSFEDGSEPEPEEPKAYYLEVSLAHPDALDAVRQILTANSIGGWSELGYTEAGNAVFTFDDSSSREEAAKVLDAEGYASKRPKKESMAGLFDYQQPAERASLTEMSAKDVASAWVDGESYAEADPVRLMGDTVFSFALPIGLREGDTFYVLKKEAAPSGETSEHISALKQALEDAGKDYAEVDDIDELRSGEGEEKETPEPEKEGPPEAVGESRLSESMSVLVRVSRDREDDLKELLQRQGSDLPGMGGYRLSRQDDDTVVLTFDSEQFGSLVVNELYRNGFQAGPVLEGKESSPVRKALQEALAVDGSESRLRLVTEGKPAGQAGMAQDLRQALEIAKGDKHAE